MRKILSAVFAAILLAVVSVACSSPKERTIDLPAITTANTSSIDILAVDMTDSATVLHMRGYHRPNYWIKIVPETYLEADGVQYHLVSADSIVPGEELYMPESGQRDFTLVFEPLPLPTERFNFIEGDDERAFRLWGVDVTGKPQPEYPEGLPSEFRKQPKDGPLPETVFEIGKTTLNIHLLNLYPGMDTGYKLYVDALDGGRDEFEVVFDEEGNATVSFDQYGTAMAFLAPESGAGTIAFLIAPGETVDVYVDLRLTGDNIRRRGGFELPHVARLFTNGRYRDFNILWAKYSDRNYRMQLYTGEFADYHMTGDEYFDMVMNQYRAYSDSVANSDYPRMVKEYRQFDLQCRVLEAISRYRMLLEHNYCHVTGDYGMHVPADSIKAVLTPEHFKAVMREIDLNNPGLALQIGIGTAPYSFDWTPYMENSDGFNRLMRKYTGTMGKIRYGLDAKEDVDTLRMYDNPFFAAACDSLRAREVRAAEAFDDGMLSVTPDVAPAKLFDAIVEPYRGKVVLVDLWNTWCGPCRAALKANEPLKSGELQSDDLVWIYIADESSPMTKYRAMIPDIKGVHYRVGADEIKAIRDRFDVDGIPFYIMVDRKGKATGHPDFRDHELMRSTLLDALK